MPEGHTIHRLARRHAKLLGGQTVRATSPQGRFADGAALIDGRQLETTDAWGKHLFHRYGRDLWLHVHLGLYGKFTDGPLPAPAPRGALRVRLEGAET
ncbi:MAG: DNA-formamidopyrimidine glycosylase family protein, partial [Friedmanniella sp.]